MHKEIGACFYCGLPVFASDGQAIRFKVLKHRRSNGAKGGKVEKRPTHKACRKGKK